MAGPLSPDPVDNRAAALRKMTDAGKWVGADLRRVSLAGVTLRGLDLSGAQLDDSDLRGARFIGVTLTGAKLDGADVTGAEFERVEATGAQLSSIRGSSSTWRQSILLLSQLSGADLTEARLTGCLLEGADLRDATLTGASLVGCSCDDADFERAILTRVETVDSTFRGAKLATARDLLGCREIVVELLRRDVDSSDNEAMMLLGGVMELRHWCYAEWKRYLDSPDLLAYRTLALSILAKYPEAKAAPALEMGLDWRR